MNGTRRDVLDPGWCSVVTRSERSASDGGPLVLYGLLDPAASIERRIGGRHAPSRRRSRERALPQRFTEERPHDRNEFTCAPLERHSEVSLCSDFGSSGRGHRVTGAMARAVAPTLARSCTTCRKRIAAELGGALRPAVAPLGRERPPQCKRCLTPRPVGRSLPRGAVPSFQRRVLARACSPKRRSRRAIDR